MAIVCPPTSNVRLVLDLATIHVTVEFCEWKTGPRETGRLTCLRQFQLAGLVRGFVRGSQRIPCPGPGDRVTRALFPIEVTVSLGRVLGIGPEGQFGSNPEVPDTVVRDWS